MGVIESGHHEVPAKIDNFGAGLLQFADLVVGADGDNPPIAR